MISIINYQQAYFFFLSSIKQYYPAFFQTPIVSAHLEIHRLKIVTPSKESGSSRPSWGRRALRWLWPEVCHRPTVKSWNDKEILGKENVVSICFNMFQYVSMVCEIWKPETKILLFTWNIYENVRFQFSLTNQSIEFTVGWYWLILYIYEFVFVLCACCTLDVSIDRSMDLSIDIHIHVHLVVHI